jgi:hypothetical protein
VLDRARDGDQLWRANRLGGLSAAFVLLHSTCSERKLAHIIPSGWRELAVIGAAGREIETLATLAEQLPDAYTVYHGVHWTRLERRVSMYGEVDFIVLAPNGRTLLIEQKSGFLTEMPDGLYKQYPGRLKHVPSQIMRSVSGLINRFDKGQERLSIDYLLYCPDHHVSQPSLAGLEPARIVDAARASQLAHIIQEIVPLTDEAPQRARVARFLGDVLDLVPDACAMTATAGELVTRLSGGLAVWARQLVFSPFRLRVIGTAGSGKTQLAIAECRAAADAGKRALYVCYNRPLADHLRRLLPDEVHVSSFHQLADTIVREWGVVPDYGKPNVWRQLEQALLEADLPERWRFDTLIVDEGQDFSDTWRDAVLRMLKPEGRAIWLEDPLQNLYGRTPVALDGWVTLNAHTNYRSPRDVVELLVRLAPSQIGEAGIEAASPFHSADIDFLSYPDGDTAAMYEQTKAAIKACLDAGFTAGDVGLVSFHGRERSRLLHLDRIGAHTLRSFTGEYDAAGQPVVRDGALLTESVYRFKGQSVPAVILTEIDFEDLDEPAFRKLFVGMTRARLKLILVLSDGAASALMRRLS